MLKEDIAEPLQAIISSMYNLPNTSLNFEDPSRGISVTVNLKNYSYMNISFSQHKEKEKGNISFKTDDFPVYAYHNSIARLAPIYDQLVFLGKHPKYANSDLMMSFSATISNVSLMLGEETLIKTENNISDRIPNDLKQEIIIFCGPVGEYFVFTIHFVKVRNPPNSVSMSALNQNINNSFIDNQSNSNNNNNNNGASNSGVSQFSTMPISYSTSAVSQAGNSNNNTLSTSPAEINSNPNSVSTFTPPANPNSGNQSSSSNINLSPTSSSPANSAVSSMTNFPSQSKVPTSISNGNLSLMGSSSINSPLLETASVSPSSINYESPAFWRPFAQDTVFPHLGREYIVVDSVMLRKKFKIQSIVLSQLKALQMLLSAISVNLSVQAEEEEIEEEEEEDNGN